MFSIPPFANAPPDPNEYRTTFLLNVDCMIINVPLLFIAPPPSFAVFPVSVDWVIVNVPLLFIAPPLFDLAFFIVMFLRTSEAPSSTTNTCCWFPSIVCPLPSIIIVTLLLNIIGSLVLYVLFPNVIVMSLSASFTADLSSSQLVTVVSVLRLVFVFLTIVLVVFSFKL